MIGLTAVIAFSALCSVGVGLFQWIAMRGELREVRRQYPALMKSADAAGSAAVTAKNALSEMKKGRRAWVGVEGFRITDYPNPFRAVVTFVNNGDTPANNVQLGQGVALIRTPLLRQPPKRYTNYHFSSSGTIAPHTEFNSILDQARGVDVGGLLAKHNDAVQSGRQILYIHGVLRYEDALGQHGTTFCFYMDNPKTHELIYCQAHNRMR